MTREPVSSSNIVSVGYDALTKVLEIEFRDKTVYQYAEVPSDVHEAMMRATSVGKFFYGRIVHNYEVIRV